LFQKLTDRGFVPDVVEGVIDTLAQENLQSDERFAELFVEQRINKGFGKHKIKAELRDRGLESELARDIMTRVEVDWVAQAVSVIGRKFGEFDDSFNKKKAMKCKRYLHSRGFNQGHIDQALAQWMAQSLEQD
jgi:regulatory protein